MSWPVMVFDIESIPDVAGMRALGLAQGDHDAQAIYQQVVVSKIMPMNNSTGITDEERALIGRWFEQGAGSK